MSHSIPLPRPGEGADKARMDEILRVDHAGEYAAVLIYRAQKAVFEGRKGRDGIARDLQARLRLRLLHLTRRAELARLVEHLLGGGEPLAQRATLALVRVERGGRRLRLLAERGEALLELGAPLQQAIVQRARLGEEGLGRRGGAGRGSGVIHCCLHATVTQEIANPFAGLSRGS